MKNPATGDLLEIDPEALTLARCIDSVEQLLAAVRRLSADYYNSTAVVELGDAMTAEGGARLEWSVPIDLKTLSVVAAMAQLPLAFRGSTDLGKTALAERVLTALFGSHGLDWWRMEMNRGMTIDDLIDVDVAKLAKAKLSEAVAGARWLDKAGRLLDELNRVHPKLLNLALHLVDGSGFNVRGDLSIPVGQPYCVGAEQKRFSFSIVTANQLDAAYAGVFEEDLAMTRRVVISADLDELPPTHRDRTKMLCERRAKAAVPPALPRTRQLIEVYESLGRVIPFSALAHLLLCYLAGMSTCVRTRSGRVRPELSPAVCEKCHLFKAHRFCGRVGGLSDGLLLRVKELATSLAAVRAVSVLEQVRRQCTREPSRTLAVAQLQNVLETKAAGDALYARFREAYLADLAVTGEDIKAAYVLVAPGHVWIDGAWLKSQPQYEQKAGYVCREVAAAAWANLLRFLRDRHELIGELVSSRTVSSAALGEIETYVTTVDPAVFFVVEVLRDEQLPLQFREELQAGRTIRAA